MTTLGFQWSDVIALLWLHNGRDGVSDHAPASRLFTQPFIQAQIKENIKAPRDWPLCGEFTGPGEFPTHKGPVTRKCFHLMTSSCLMTYARGCVVLCFVYFGYQILCALYTFYNFCTMYRFITFIQSFMHPCMFFIYPHSLVHVCIACSESYNCPIRSSEGLGKNRLTPADTRRKNNVIVTLKTTLWRRFGVIVTLLLRRVSVWVPQH